MQNHIYLRLKKWLARRAGFQFYLSGTPLGLDLRRDLAQLAPGFAPRTILDVGANIGQTALEFSALWPEAQIHCFEPVHSTYMKLEKNTNHLRSRISIHNVALSSSCGQAEIWLGTESLMSTLQETPLVVEKMSSVREVVSTETLSFWCEDNDVDEVDLLKIDVEGHEPQVLCGGEELFAGDQVGAVLLEVHLGRSSGGAFEAVSSWLNDHRFELVGIYDQTVWLPGHLFFANFLYLHESKTVTG